MLKTSKKSFAKLFLLTLLVLPISAEIDDLQLQKEMVEDLPMDQREKVLQKLQQASGLQTEIDEIFEEENSLIKKPELYKLSEDQTCSTCIFGYDYFQYSPTTFAPVSGVPVTSDYIVGPGDKFSISYFGNEVLKTESFVSREGNLILPLIGPVNLLGLSYNNAIELIKNRVSTDLIGTQVSISLLELRSISIYMLGESYKPGKYTISGLSSVTNTLFITGGVSEEGSLRNIQIRRNNKVIATYDFYDFLLNGSTESDIQLEDGDVIFIPFIENKVRLGEAFKRPHLYEFRPGENISDAIKMAGGYKFDVNPGAKLEVSFIDADSFKRELQRFSFTDASERSLQDGDIINIPKTSGLEYRTVTLTGEFQNPGEYSIQDGDRILDLIYRAGGYSSSAYSEGGIFLRKSVAELQKESYLRTADLLEKTLVDAVTQGNLTDVNLEPITVLIEKIRTEDPIGRMVVDLDSLSLKTDPMLNFIVHDGDTIHIPKRPNSISVAGEVLNPSTLAFRPGLSALKYIDLAGGLNETADENKIFVILPNGQSEVVKRSLFGGSTNLLPGSTIYATRDPKPFDAIKITSIVMPILADLATSAAAIAAISD